MKMLTRNGNTEYLTDLKDLLEENGIPYLSSMGLKLHE